MLTKCYNIVLLNSIELIHVKKKASPITGKFFCIQESLDIEIFCCPSNKEKKKRANPKRLATILTTLCRTETKKLVFLINFTIFHICETTLSILCGWRGIFNAMRSGPFALRSYCCSTRDSRRRCSKPRASGRQPQETVLLSGFGSPYRTQ